MQRSFSPIINFAENLIGLKWHTNHQSIVFAYFNHKILSAMSHEYKQTRQ